MKTEESEKKKKKKTSGDFQLFSFLSFKAKFHV